MISLAVVLLLLTGSADAELPRIGIIDFYGLRHVSELQARKALQITEGDTMPDSSAAARRRLEALPGVVRVHFDVVCCETGKSILYVGIEEKGAPSLRFRTAPQGTVRLPADVVQAGRAFEETFRKAILNGDTGEDDSQGHALMHNSAARAIQERFISYAARDLNRLRDVLRNSADAEQRALAAEVLGYAANKGDVVGDLVEGMRDPAEGVRNDSMRALAVIAGFAQGSPERHIQVPAQPFVEMLDSLIWTDRNKASFALMELSEKRDPALLASLRERALPSLIEMARWKSQGHALAAFLLLGRVGGMSEGEIHAAWGRGDREAVIDAARLPRHPPRPLDHTC